jgi:trigger factor
MQVQVETVSALERRMTVKVPAQRVEDEVESRLKSLSRTASLKGFRPGKVPFKVVQQNFGPQVRDEVLNELLRQTWGEAVVQQKLNPAGGPKLEPLKVEPGKDLEYAATFEVYPDVTLKGLDALKVEKPVAEVTEPDVDKMVENLRRQRGTWKPAARAAAEGDRATIDFEGTLDGQPFPGNKGERLPVVIGSGRMVAGFEQKLIGQTAGKELEFDIEFPHDHATVQLAGRTVRFKVKLHEVAELELPPLDDAFCKAFGVSEGGVARLRADVRENMTRELGETVRRRVKEQVLEALLAANSVELPKSLVEEQIQRLQRDALQRMGLLDSNHQPELPRDMFEEQARKQVKLGLLIGEVLQSQKIKLDPARVERSLAELVSEYQDREGALRAYRGNRDVMRQIENHALEEQAVDFLLDKAKLTDKKSSFAELMRFGADAK